LMDIAFSKKLGKHLLIKGGIQDLLNKPFEYKQFNTFNKDTNGDGVGDTKVTKSQTTMSYLRGSYYTLGIAFNL